MSGKSEAYLIVVQFVVKQVYCIKMYYDILTSSYRYQSLLTKKRLRVRYSNIGSLEPPSSYIYRCTCNPVLLFIPSPIFWGALPYLIHLIHNLVILYFIFVNKYIIVYEIPKYMMTI